MTGKFYWLRNIFRKINKLRKASSLFSTYSTNIGWLIKHFISTKCVAMNRNVEQHLPRTKFNYPVFLCDKGGAFKCKFHRLNQSKHDWLMFERSMYTFVLEYWKPILFYNSRSILFWLLAISIGNFLCQLRFNPMLWAGVNRVKRQPFMKLHVSGVGL